MTTGQLVELLGAIGVLVGGGVVVVLYFGGRVAQQAVKEAHAVAASLNAAQAAAAAALAAAQQQVATTLVASQAETTTALAAINRNLTVQTQLAQAQGVVLTEMANLLRISAPLHITPAQRRALLALLEASTLFRTSAQRGRLLEDLPDGIRTNVPRAEAATEDLTAIVQTVLDLGSRDDFTTLLENVAAVVKGTRLAGEFAEFRRANGWQPTRPLL